MTTGRSPYQKDQEDEELLDHLTQESPFRSSFLSAEGRGESGQRPVSYGATESEAALLQSIEHRRVSAAGSAVTFDGDMFHPAIPGEKPPLGVSKLGRALSDMGGALDAASLSSSPPKSTGGTTSAGENPRKINLKRAVNRVRALNAATNVTRRRASDQALQARRMSLGVGVAGHRRKNALGNKGGHQRAQKLLESIDEANMMANQDTAAHKKSNKGNKNADGTHAGHGSGSAAGGSGSAAAGGNAVVVTNTEILNATGTDVKDLQSMDKILRDDISSDSSSSSSSSGIVSTGRGDRQRHSHAEERYHTNDGLPMLSRQSSGHSTIKARRKLARKRRKKRRLYVILNILNPFNIIRGIIGLILRSFLPLACPFFIAAWVLYYYMGNPTPDFLPGNATLSWWLNFFGRQLIVLELSRLCQFLLIDCLTLSTRVVAYLFGPWITIFCLQSKGWPFVVFSWGLLDLFLLHGDNPFQRHWLSVTNIEVEIYSMANSGSYILDSDIYLRLLVGMLIAGFATSLKRTMLTLYYGRRNFEMFKPKLEAILSDIILISEVAALAAEADLLGEDQSVDSFEEVEPKFEKQRSLPQVRWASVRFKRDSLTQLSKGSGDEDILNGPATDVGSGSRAIPPSIGAPMVGGGAEVPHAALGRDISAITATERSYQGRVKLKYLLDRWDEPKNKQDRVTKCTVNDILKFRRALQYMDLQHPFTQAFGPARNRDELIASAKRVYLRLMKLAPDLPVLPASSVFILAEDEEGGTDYEKQRALLKMFAPDKDEDIPLINFIQGCDATYKKLRYFRASVGNSSVIDGVFEGIINSVFHFVLALIILSLLRFNPWPLLVSMSTLLVTFAFAVGPSASKSLEGILLIVGRRPFDIGDRIIISDSPGGKVPGVGESWFVEDINLFSTTLRYAKENEIATVSNGSLAASRIINCARSNSAMVNLYLKLHIHMHVGTNTQYFREGIEAYIQDNPNCWESIVIFTCEDINSTDEWVLYRLGIRSRHSWQNAVRVMQEKGRLHRYTMELADRLGVKYHVPNPRQVMYYGGNLVDGAVKEYKKDLLRATNIDSNGEAGPFGSKSNPTQQQQRRESNAWWASPMG